MSDSATPQTVACQALLSMGFPRVGCQFFLQRIFLSQGSNPLLLHWQADSLPLTHLESLLKDALTLSSPSIHPPRPQGATILILTPQLEWVYTLYMKSYRGVFFQHNVCEVLLCYVYQ